MFRTTGVLTEYIFSVGTSTLRQGLTKDFRRHLATLFLESKRRVFSGTLRTRSMTGRCAALVSRCRKAPVPPGAFHCSCMPT